MSYRLFVNKYLFNIYVSCFVHYIILNIAVWVENSGGKAAQ